MTTPVTGTLTSAAQDAAAESSSTKSTARTIAHMITQKMFNEGGEQATPTTAVKPPVAQPTLPTPDAQVQSQTPTSTEPVAQPVTQVATAEGQDEVLEEAGPDLDEITRIVEETALDLGIHPRDVPAELLPVFEKLVQNAIEVRTAAESERQQAAEQVEQVQEFAKQLKENPDRLLLTLAVSNPDVFTQAVETFNEMQANPKVRDMVIRELQSEARLKEAERRERVLNDSAHRDRAQKVITAAKVASRKHGIPFDLAETHVAAAITANQGNFEASDVDGVISKLANDLRGKNLIRKAAPRVATPAKVAAAAAAPNTEVGSGTAPGPQGGGSTASAGLTETTPHGRLRGIIKGALGRMRPDQQ